jgi:hypothetical protein
MVDSILCSTKVWPQSNPDLLSVPLDRFETDTKCSLKLLYLADIVANKFVK